MCTVSRLECADPKLPHCACFTRPGGGVFGSAPHGRRHSPRETLLGRSCEVHHPAPPKGPFCTVRTLKNPSKTRQKTLKKTKEISQEEKHQGNKNTKKKKDRVVLGITDIFPLAWCFRKDQGKVYGHGNFVRRSCGAIVNHRCRSKLHFT